MAAAVQYAFEHHVSIEPNSSPVSARRLGRNILAALEEGRRHVVVDCAHWQHLDVVLLSSLVNCFRVFTSQGATIELVNLSDEMQSNLRELRLHHRLSLAD